MIHYFCLLSNFQSFFAFVVSLSFTSNKVCNYFPMENSADQLTFNIAVPIKIYAIDKYLSATYKILRLGVS